MAPSTAGHTLVPSAVGVCPSFSTGRPSAPISRAHVSFLTNGLASRSAPVGAIEHVEETVAVRVQEQLAGLPVPVRIDEHGRLLRIPVPEVVRRVLEVPLEPSSRGIQREDRVGVEIVAVPLAAVVVGTRIARRPVERLERRIVGARQPRGAAAMFDVASPSMCPSPARPASAPSRTRHASFPVSVSNAATNPRMPSSPPDGPEITSLPTTSGADVAP